MTGYIDAIKEVLDQNLDRDDTIDELDDIVSEAMTAAAEETTDAVDDARNNDLETAKNEWREIVASFERGDMPDVRQRLMDMGQRAFGVDVFIRSRK